MPANLARRDLPGAGIVDGIATPPREGVAVRIPAPNGVDVRWLVDVNGHLIQTQSTDNTIQMIIPIPAGRSRIQISWVEGWDRKVGGGISAASVLLLGFLWIRCKHSVHLDTSAKANA